MVNYFDMFMYNRVSCVRLEGELMCYLASIGVYVSVYVEDNVFELNICF